MSNNTYSINFISETAQRRSYTLNFKKKVLKHYKKGVNGCGMLSVANQFGIKVRTLRHWIENSEEINKAAKDANSRGVIKFRMSGGGQKTKFPDVNDRCLQWINNMETQGINVTDNELRIKAKQFAVELGVDGFSASLKWMDLFKKRRNLAARRERKSRVLPPYAESKVIKNDTTMLVSED